MNTAVDQFFSFVESERTGHVKRLRFAALMCILILALLYRTEWLILRPGLLILFAGQAGVAMALFVRTSNLGKHCTLGRLVRYKKMKSLPGSKAKSLLFAV